MMKKALLLNLILTIVSCNSQEKEKVENAKDTLVPIKIEIPINPKTMEAYTTEEFTLEDVENYKKCKKERDGYCEYIRHDGATIIEDDNEMVLFTRSIILKNSFFTINKEYHPNRRLWMKYQQYNNGSFKKGIFYEYNEQGKLIKAEDWDKPFIFTWEQVKKYIEQDLKLDLLKDKVAISNDLEFPGYTFPTWSITYVGKYRDNPKGGIIRIMLNGTTGELLFVERQLGKGGEGTIVDVLYKK